MRNSSVFSGLDATPCQPDGPTLAIGTVGKLTAEFPGFSSFCATGSNSEGQITVGEPQVNWAGNAFTRPVRFPVRSAAVGTVAPVKKMLLSCLDTLVRSEEKRLVFPDGAASVPPNWFRRIGGSAGSSPRYWRSARRSANSRKEKREKRWCRIL